MDSVTRRDQKASNSRLRFTADVIRAIEDLELRRVNVSDAELADSAWQKLQYDLPVVEPQELAALVDRLGSSLQGKVGWPCYALTSKALENITNGAKRNSSSQPELPQHDQQLQQLLTDAISASIKAKASHSSRPKQQQQAAQAQSNRGSAANQQRGHTLQDQYQQLCATVLLQYVGKIVSLSEQDGWQLLQDYHPEQNVAQQCHDQQLSWQQADQQQLGYCQDEVTDQQLVESLLLHGPPPSTAVATASAIAHHALQSASSSAVDDAAAAAAGSTSVYEDCEAAVQESDGDDYEPYEPLESIRAVPNGPKSALQWQQQQQQAPPYSWRDLRHKLLAIADHVHYNLMSCEHLWQKQAAAQHVLQVLRAVGVHSHAAELQPVVHAYAGLLVDRITAAPGDLQLLQQLWEALGLTGRGLPGSGGVLRGRQSGHTSGRHDPSQGLPAEAVLGLTAAASVWQQVAGTSSRSKLWQLMYDNLLQLLEQCTEQLAYSSRSGTPQQQLNSSSPGCRLDHVQLVCHIIELLVLGRPAGVDAAGQLTQLGITRNLVQLFTEHGTDAAAELLRRAVLLSCCSSQQTASWVLAVPAVMHVLQRPVFQFSGAAEAHGALWELLISRQKPTAIPGHTKSGAACIASGVAGQQGSSSSCSSGCSLLLQILEMVPDSVQQLQRKVLLLQMMVDAQKAAGKSHVWEGNITAAVKQLSSRMKQLQTADTHATAGSTTVAADSVERVDLGPASVNGALANGAPAAYDDDNKEQQKLQRHSSTAAGESFEHRQLQQLCLTASKLVKELVTQGGKTD